MNKQEGVPTAIATQIGYLTKDINLYDFINQTNLGKSAIGKEMDLAGRHLLNHRMGGGHLWWKELNNRPIHEWNDVIQHLASDFPTKAGLPLAFDHSHVNNPDIIKSLGLKELASSKNWGMVNAFDFIAGSVSIAVATHEFLGDHEIYTQDMALATDCAFVAINIGSGVATCNPLLIIGAIIKTGSILRKITSSSFSGIDIHPGYFDLNVDELLRVPNFTTVNSHDLLGLNQLDIHW